MPRRIFLAAILAGAAALGVYWWLTAPPTAWAATGPAYTPNVANGLTTFNAGGCSSCHAVPGQPDRLRLGGGLAIPSPFGTFYAPNISPDPVDGIGQSARSRRAVSIQCQAQHRDLEIAVHGRQAFHAGRGAFKSVESRRLPG